MKPRWARTTTTRRTRSPQGHDEFASRVPDEYSTEERRWVTVEARLGLGGIIAALPRWLNHPSDIARAEFKPVQLQTARAVGLTEQAHVNLNQAGYAPSVHAADGAAGHASGAPYDRLIATCSVVTVPPAWLAQVRPGGVILTNLYRQLVGDCLVRLTVREDGTATGRLLDDSGGFMPLRAHRHPDPWELVKAASSQEGIKRPSHLPAPVGDDGEAWTVLADLLMTGTARTDITRDDGNVQWLVHPEGS